MSLKRFTTCLWLTFFSVILVHCMLLAHSHLSKPGVVAAVSKQVHYMLLTGFPVLSLSSLLTATNYLCCSTVVCECFHLFHKWDLSFWLVKWNWQFTVGTYSFKIGHDQSSLYSTCIESRKPMHSMSLLSLPCVWCVDMGPLPNQLQALSTGSLSRG